jgi:pimeloyl-ACP methyl ester carboxylesterase
MQEPSPKQQDSDPAPILSLTDQPTGLTRRKFLAAASTATLGGTILGTREALAGTIDPPPPLVLARQGSLFVGGSTVSGSGTFDPAANILLFSNDGDTFWIEQLYARFQIPPSARSLPIVLVHGAGQTGKTWESTPDGRDGYETILVRQGFGTYIVDFPFRGRAGYPSFTGNLGNLTGTQIIPDETTRYGNITAFILFRLGQTPFTFFPNSQFPQSGLNQFSQQIVPFFEADEDPDLISGAIASLFDRIGPAILVTHSQAGQFGWLAAIKSPNVKAIIAYEPAIFYFPTGAVPTPPPMFDGTILPIGLPIAPSDFQKLAQIPIQIIYGDNIPSNPVPIFGLDMWRVITAYAPAFVSAVNSQGGNASILSLPKAGLFGNTHFAFSDLNNVAVADLLFSFLHSNNLDR